MTATTIELPGLIKMSEEQISALDPEEAGQMLDDLRQLREAQHMLRGVKLLDTVKRKAMSHRDVTEMLLDIRNAAMCIST